MDDLVDFLVIIPTFRRPDQLCAAIKSVISQAGVTKRIFVVDDCPNGSAEEAVGRFPEACYLRNPEPSGGWPGRVRNYGFNHSIKTGVRSNYVHFLDDDDTVPPGHYPVVKYAFEKHPDVGVVFGVLRPFCEFSIDPSYREKQELQLREVRKWRQETARRPWLFEDIRAKLGLPGLARNLFHQFAIFGPEMFLCSGGIIRTQHVTELGGFPDVRITQDFEFFTAAIRKFDTIFLKRETAGYRIGSAVAIWNPLELEPDEKTAHRNEWTQELKARQGAIQQEVGKFKFYILKIAFRIQRELVNRMIIPLLDRRGYFAELDLITNPDHLTPERIP